MFNRSRNYSPSCTMFSCIDGTAVTIISSMCTSVSAFKDLVEDEGGVIRFEVVGMDDSSFTKSRKEMKQLSDVWYCKVYLLNL